MSAVLAVTLVGGWVAGTEAAIAPSCTLVQNVGLHAHDDLKLMDTNDTGSCCNFCANTSGCVAFTLNGGVCRAKGAKALDPSCRMACKNCVSGFLPAPPPTVHPTPSSHTPAPVPQPPLGYAPHIFFVLQDDLGFNDVGFNNPLMEPVSSNITKLAREGVQLTNHLVHFHCSPTRRSFISGRLPIHHGEMLSETDGDDVDLRWSLVSDKLKAAGYSTHWVGKGHTGYKSMAHLPIRRGFDSHLGFLSGSQKYTSSDRWRDEGPDNITTYSTDLFGQRVVDIINTHDATDTAKPLFVYLPWQAVHSPYDDVPGRNNSCTPDAAYPGVYAQMLHDVDDWMGRIVAGLQKKGMWEHTLMVYTSDNGGVSWNKLAGINFPFRGEKHGNWRGGMNVATFVVGGVVPAALSGTSNPSRFHVVDWYPTFCALAGLNAAQCADDPPVPPLPVDPDNLDKDIYGDDSWPSLDGKNIWPTIMAGEAAAAADPYTIHSNLTLTAQVLVHREYKLLLGQGTVGDSGEKTEPDWSGGAPGKGQPPTDGWHLANGTWVTATSVGWKCGLAHGKNAKYIPCIFNETADPREEKDLAPRIPSEVDQLWRALNLSVATYFHSRSPDSLVGKCNEACAKAYWKALGSTTGAGPICGVPGCD